MRVTAERGRDVRPPKGDGERLAGLDLLRAMAIVWVMLFHSFVVGGLGPNWDWLSRDGWMGVDLFFVLSGFLIGAQVLEMASSGQSGKLVDFYLRRALRIVPAYAVVLALYASFPGFREAPGLEPVWKFMTFVVNLSIDYPAHAAFSHAWSLCVEEHFYLIFPLVAVGIRSRPSARRWVGLGGLLLGCGIALRSMTWLHNAAVDPSMERNWFIEDIYYPTWNRLDGLVVGMMLAAWKVWHPNAWHGARRFADAALVGGLLVLAVAVGLFRDRVGLLGNSIGWPVLSAGMGLLVFAAAGHEGVLGRFRLPGAQWLAAISYSLYLVHKSVFHLVQSRWGAELQGQGIWAFVGYGAAAVAAGALLHGSVERPFLLLRDHVLSRRRPITSRRLPR